ncbi:MAG: hypothetical protein EA402_04725 [Planctomycetota bacterium]|nr:MAG: hypothetical protein EA402_04725 [Planctomycetota bacterium]
MLASGFICQISNQMSQLALDEALWVPGSLHLNATVYSPDFSHYRGTESLQMHVHDGADRSARVSVELLVGGAATPCRA